MEFLYNKTYNGKNKVITMQHGEDVIEWRIEKYRSFTPDELVFGDINRAISRLPEDKQQAMFEAYQEIRQATYSVPSLIKLDRLIKNNLKKIEELLPYEILVLQSNQDGDFWIPPDPKKQQTKMEVNLAAFQETVEQEDTGLDDDVATDVDNVDRESLSLTYTRRDIIDLNVLLIYIKLYLPVLSDYNIHIGNDIPPLFQQIKTIDLISHLDFTKEQGWKRLDAYVDLFWQGHKRKMELNPSILLQGLSLNGVVDWLMAELVFKILLPTGVSHTTQKMEDKERPNFIGRLFHTLDSYAGSITKNTKMEYYMDKGTPPNESPGDDRASKLESCRVVSEFRETDIQQYNVFCENMDFLLPHFDSTLPKALLEEVSFHSATHRSKNILRDIVMKWVCAKAVSPRILDYISDQGYGNLFRITYTLLKHWGFDGIADIIDGRIDFDVSRVMAFDTVEISVDQLKTLQKMYPHEIEQNRVKGEAKRHANYATLACEELFEEMRGRTYTAFHTQQTQVCHYRLKYWLADLIIYMNQNNHIN